MTVTLDQLQALAATLPQEPKQTRRNTQKGGGAFDIDRWIAENGLDVIGPTDWKDGQRWVFRVCPWNDDHTNHSAFILQFGNGAIAAGCHHNGCIGKGWHDLRRLYEPAFEQR